MDGFCFTNHIRLEITSVKCENSFVATAYFGVYSRNKLCQINFKVSFNIHTRQINVIAVSPSSRVDSAYHMSTIIYLIKENLLDDQFRTVNILLII